MQHWRLTLTYDGTPFHGWQVQPGLPTVQGTLAQALHRLTGETVLPQGSGRTDTGVHALAQVATFSLAAPIPPPNLLRALNRALPATIRVLAATHVPADFHARYSASAKTYEYRIHTGALCPPFLAPYVWSSPWPFNLALAQAAEGCILGTHDFTSFAAVDPDRTTRQRNASQNADESPGAPAQPQLEVELNLRTIHHSCWHQSGDLITYRITGSGFLHHMVRNLVGTFVEIAAGRRPPDAIPPILAARNRSAAGPTAPARGLFLVSVQYPTEPTP